MRGLVRASEAVTTSEDVGIRSLKGQLATSCTVLSTNVTFSSESNSSQRTCSLDKFQPFEFAIISQTNVGKEGWKQASSIIITGSLRSNWSGLWHNNCQAALTAASTLPLRTACQSQETNCETNFLQRGLEQLCVVPLFQSRQVHSIAVLLCVCYNSSVAFPKTIQSYMRGRPLVDNCRLGWKATRVVRKEDKEKFLLHSAWGLESTEWKKMAHFSFLIWSALHTTAACPARRKRRTRMNQKTRRRSSLPEWR